MGLNFVRYTAEILVHLQYPVLLLVMFTPGPPPQAEGDGGFAAWESWARLQRAHTGLGRTAGGIRAE